MCPRQGSGGCSKGTRPHRQAYAQVLMELDGTGTPVAKYTYGDDLLKVSRNGDYYYFYDGLGSTRAMTNASGAIINRDTYDAYGNLVYSSDGELYVTLDHYKTVEYIGRWQ